MKSNCTALAVAAMTTILALSQESHAADSNWNNPTVGAWQTPVFWSNGVPGARDLAYFGASAGLTPFQVFFIADAAVETLGVHSQSPSLQLNGFSLVVANELRVWNEVVPDTTLVITGGHVSAAFVFVGTPTGHQGTLNVVGRGATLTASQKISVGGAYSLNQGTGVLRVLSGAHVAAPTCEVGVEGGTGVLIVTGGSTLLEGLTACAAGGGPPGAPSSGAVLVFDGAHLSSRNPVTQAPQFAFIGIADGDSGTVLISGPGTVWDDIGWLTVGGVYHTNTTGHGVLVVEDGAAVSSMRGIIAQRDLSRGEVTLRTGGHWSIANDLSFGGIDAATPPTLSIQSGAYLTCATANIPANAIVDMVLGSDTPTPIVASANVTLNGTLIVDLESGFVPDIGDSLVLMQYGSRNGEFAALELPEVPGRSFVPIYGPTSLSMDVFDGVASVTIEPGSAILYEGIPYSAQAIATFSEGGVADVTALALWSSDDPAIASVNDYGHVTGVAEGATIIRAAYLGLEGAMTVDVVPTPSVLPHSLASVSTEGAQGNADTDFFGPTTISADGRYVIFGSGATNLVPDDTNGTFDVFAHDRSSGQTNRVSVASDGAQANGASAYAGYGVASSDGRFVTFFSVASNLVPDDTNAQADAFVRDQVMGETSRVSLSTEGAQGNGESEGFHISADGRFVLLRSFANNLVPTDTNDAPDLFVHDRMTGETTRVSVSAEGEQASMGVLTPGFMSPDARFILFRSLSNDLVDSDTNLGDDLFLKDRVTGAIEIVNIAPDGNQLAGVNGAASVSGDGRYVAFEGVFNANGPPLLIYLRDRQLGDTEVVSLDAEGNAADGNSFRPRLTPDGHHLAFYSLASNLVAGVPSNGFRQVYVRDLLLGTNNLVSESVYGQPGNEHSSQGNLPAISDDGRVVAYKSVATNLAAFDFNDFADAMVTERWLPADLNGDGVVDVNDLVIVILNWGQCGAEICEGDVNGDDVVDVSDLVAIILAWG